MLLLGSRFEIALATWASRVAGIENALWREENAQGYPLYIALVAGSAEVVSDTTYQAVQTVERTRLAFSPVLGSALRYQVAIGQVPLLADVGAADDAEQAQARVLEGWAAGMWGEDGWTLEPLGGEVWQLEPPSGLGFMPAVDPGYGWTITDEDLAPALSDVTHLTHLVTVTMVVRAPVRSRDIAVAAAGRIYSAIRSQAELADRGAELGLAWGNRPTLTTPQFTLEAQADLGGIIDAAQVEVRVYAHSLMRTLGESMGAASIQIVPLPGPAVPTIEISAS